MKIPIYNILFVVCIQKILNIGIDIYWLPLTTTDYTDYYFGTCTYWIWVVSIFKFDIYWLLYKNMYICTKFHNYLFIIIGSRNINYLWKFHKIFLTKFYFLKIQKWPFWTGKKFKTARNVILREKNLIYLISRFFLPGLF